MSWRDSNSTNSYDDHAGTGASGFLRRVFGDGENPMTWALPLYSLWGIRVRVHILLVLFTLGRVIWSLFNDTSTAITLGWMGSLWGLVLLHEYGHCFAARKVGGDADEIILWPLGGLAMCQIPEHWKDHLIVALAGPAVNLALLPVFALAILLATGDASLILFNPLHPELAMMSPSMAGGWVMGKQLLLAAHQINVFLLAFNMLIAMFPMDGGRVVHALLWKNRDRSEAMAIAARIGLAFAVILIAGGLISNNVTLAFIGLFGGLICWQELRVMRFEADPISLSAQMRELDNDADLPSRRELKAQEKQEAKELEVDRILEKISTEGMDALSAKERKTLANASKSRRKTP